MMFLHQVPITAAKAETDYAMRSLLDASTHDQQWESNPRPLDLEFNAISTRPHAPRLDLHKYEGKASPLSTLQPKQKK